MSPEQQIERSVLAGKDREELQTIAGAMGVTATSRMRKADLIEAILTAGNGANGAMDAAGAEAPKPRRVRSARASELEQDSIAALAEEEDALGSSSSDGDDAPLPRPRNRAASMTGADAPANGAAASTDAATTADSAPDTTTDTSTDGSDTREAVARDGGATSTRPIDPEDERQSFGDGNRRSRRRRRGRGGQEQGGGEPRQSEYQGEPIEVLGLLDLRDEGYGFLRAGGYLPGAKDVYVSASQVRRFALRKGDYVRGTSRPQASNEKYPALLRVDEINGMTPDDARNRPKFEDRTPLFPDSRLKLELADEPHETLGRIVDLISPIGKGQRGMIVSPSKAGKTTILKQFVHAVERNNPEVHLM